MKSTYSLSKFRGYTPDLVVGTSYYKKNHRALIRSLRLNLEEYQRTEIVVELIPEPDNPYSPARQAISVRWNNKVLGHIKESEAGNYQQIKRLVASGYTPVCKATYTAYEHEKWDDYDYINLDSYKPKKELVTKIELYLDDFNYLVPLNDPPVEGWTLLPIGTSLQVTKENEHYDHLLDYVPESGEGLLLVSLHIIEGGVKTKFEQVEVRLDEEPIGVLTKQSSARFVDAIKHFDAIGLTTVAYGKIKGSSLAAEVTIHALRSNELSNDDLDPEISPLRKLVPFEVDPHNYEVPPAYPGKSTPTQRAQKRPERKGFGAPNPTEVLRQKDSQKPAAPKTPAEAHDDLLQGQPPVSEAKPATQLAEQSHLQFNEARQRGSEQLAKVPKIILQLLGGLLGALVCLFIAALLIGMILGDPEADAPAWPGVVMLAAVLFGGYGGAKWLGAFARKKKK